MKRKNIFLVMVLILSGIFAIQSCKKEAPVETTVVMAAMPAAPDPGVDAIVPFTGTGQTINLAWTGTATNAVKWDVYFGKKSSPALAASGVTTNTFNTTITKGGTYYWQVSTTDVNGVNTVSPVWSFEVNSNPNVPSTPVPTLNKVNVSCNPNIQWAASDPEGDALTYDLYLGTTASPAPYSSGLADTSLVITATLLPTTAYYWKVVAHDPYGGVSTSPIWKFTTGLLPVAKFVGNYNTDEPAEAYKANLYNVQLYIFSRVDWGRIWYNNTSNR